MTPASGNCLTVLAIIKMMSQEAPREPISRALIINTGTGCVSRLFEMPDGSKQWLETGEAVVPLPIEVAMSEMVAARHKREADNTGAEREETSS